MDLEKYLTKLAKEWMMREGWNQRELANAMSITPSEMSLVLAGKRPWTLRRVHSFAKATGECILIDGR